MRCRICETVHKNTKRHELWFEKQVCRTCGSLFELFCWNDNRLLNYWKGGVQEKLSDWIISEGDDYGFNLEDFFK